MIKNFNQWEENKNQSIDEATGSGLLKNIPKYVSNLFKFTEKEWKNFTPEIREAFEKLSQKEFKELPLEVRINLKKNANDLVDDFKKAYNTMSKQELDDAIKNFEKFGKQVEKLQDTHKKIEDFTDFIDWPKGETKNALLKAKNSMDDYLIAASSKLKDYDTEISAVNGLIKDGNRWKKNVGKLSAKASKAVKPADEVVADIVNSLKNDEPQEILQNVDNAISDASSMGTSSRSELRDELNKKAEGLVDDAGKELQNDATDSIESSGDVKGPKKNLNILAKAKKLYKVSKWVTASIFLFAVGEWMRREFFSKGETPENVASNARGSATAGVSDSINKYIDLNSFRTTTSSDSIPGFKQEALPTDVKYSESGTEKTIADIAANTQDAFICKPITYFSYYRDSLISNQDGMFSMLTELNKSKDLYSVFVKVSEKGKEGLSDFYENGSPIRFGNHKLSLSDKGVKNLFYTENLRGDSGDAAAALNGASVFCGMFSSFKNTVESGRVKTDVYRFMQTDEGKDVQLKNLEKFNEEMQTIQSNKSSASDFALWCDWLFTCLASIPSSNSPFQSGKYLSASLFGSGQLGNCIKAMSFITGTPSGYEKIGQSKILNSIFGDYVDEVTSTIKGRSPEKGSLIDKYGTNGHYFSVMRDIMALCMMNETCSMLIPKKANEGIENVSHENVTRLQSLLQQAEILLEGVSSVVPNGVMDTETVNAWKNIKVVANLKSEFPKINEIPVLLEWVMNELDRNI